MNIKQNTYHPNHKKLARIAKALGHPARVAIMVHLSRANGCCAGELRLNMPLAQSTVSQHLKVLCEANLITSSTDPPRVWYCINRAAWDEARHLFGLFP